MNKIILFASLMICTIAQAHVIEVNQQESTVYVHPTPVIEVTLQDLGDDGGVLYLTLTYDGVRSKAEIANLQKQYPGYQVVALVANSNGNSTLDIADIVHETISVRQQQLGPQINTQLQLKPEQMNRVRKLGDGLAGTIQLQVPATVTYTSTQIVEQYATDTNICESLRVQSVKDLIVNFGRMVKPAQITRAQTFESLKADMLTKCFAVKEESADSFADLLKLKVSTLKSGESIVGQTLQKQDVTKAFIITPILKLNTL
jgi:hypothetical protein